MKKTAQELRELLGSTIRIYRLTQGWTQRGLAEELQEVGFLRCTRSWLARIESGEIKLRCFEIFYFRKLFGKRFEADFWKIYYGPKRKRSVSPGKRF